MHAKSILDRKSAIDCVHLAQHRPLYIETESYIATDGDVEGSKEYSAAISKLRQLMVTMIERSNFFVGVYSSDAGKRYKELDHKSPIVFELHTFLEHLKKNDLLHEAHDRIRLFRTQESDAHWVDEKLADWGLPRQPKIIEFNDYSDLIGLIFDEVRYLETEPQGDTSTARDLTIDIEYHGTDQADLLRIISEYLFSQHAMNIDHVWGSAKGEVAMLNISASLVGDSLEFPGNEALESDLRTAVGVHLGLAASKVPLNVHSRPAQFEETAFGYVEVRCIDAPGQLNTICKAITDLDLNMTQLHLAPAPPEFPRQTVIAITVKLDRKAEGLSQRAHFLRVESKIRDLVGVRAIGTRLSKPLTTDSNGS